MSLLQRIFGTSSKKRDVEDESTSASYLRSPHSKVAGMEGVPVIARSVHSDPVPTSLRSNPSFSGSRQRISSPLLKSHTVPTYTEDTDSTSPVLVSSHVLSTGALAVLSKHQEPVTNHSIVSQQSAPSYWKLPWSSPKVIMCSYCQRPQNRGQPHMRSAEYKHKRPMGDLNGDGLPTLEEDDNMSSLHSPSESTGSEASSARSYCHCGMSCAANREDSCDLSCPPVYVVQSQHGRCTSATHPGETSGEDNCEEDVRPSIKVSLVSPLMRQSLVGSCGEQKGKSRLNPPGSCLANGRDGKPEAKPSLSAWLNTIER